MKWKVNKKDGKYLSKDSDNKPWAYISLKGYFAGLIFGASAYFRRGLLSEGILRFKMGCAWQ